VTGAGRRLPVVGGGEGPRSPATFHRIAIVGLGALGGSVALALRQVWPASLVIGVDAHTVIEPAIRLHAIDVGADDLIIAADADLVILAGGPDEDARVMPYLAGAVPPNTVVLILGAPLGAAGAPAAGPGGAQPLVYARPDIEDSGRGITAARAGLVLGRRWTIAPLSAGIEVVDRVLGLVRALGGEPVLRAS
jgi:hypothetical protein